jgi:hypothetical protein
MSPEPQKPKLQIKAEPENCMIVNQPVVRNFSTGGGHGPEDTLVEGDLKLVTRKWQGYPPDKCNIIGKSFAAMPEVMLPRFTGKALYATRVVLPNMLYCKARQPASPGEGEVDRHFQGGEDAGRGVHIDVREWPKNVSDNDAPGLPGRGCGDRGGRDRGATGHGPEPTGPEHPSER